MHSSAPGTLKIRQPSSIRSVPTSRNLSTERKLQTTSRSWCCAGTGLAHVDFYSPIPRLGNPVGRRDQRLASAAASGQDPVSRDTHSRQDRLHPLGPLKRKRIVGWIRADLIGVANNSDVWRLSARHLDEQTLYFLLRFLGKFVVTT